MRLGSGVAVAEADNGSSDLTPAQKLLYATGAALKKKKKKSLFSL